MNPELQLPSLFLTIDGTVLMTDGPVAGRWIEADGFEWLEDWA